MLILEFSFLETMGWEKWQQNGKKLFHILTTTLFTLLLPLSFLILSRLSVASYLLSSSSPSSQTQPIWISNFLSFHIIPTILYILISLMSSFSFVHALTGQNMNLSTKPVFPMCISWFLLCAFQVCVGLFCVGLGIEGTFSTRLHDSDFSHGISLISRVVFFVGLHETMTYWSRTVVKPVVDNNLSGKRMFTQKPMKVLLGFREEGWTERVAVAVGLGGLWWWRLKGEIESLVLIMEIKKRVMIGVGVGDVIGWWLYYLTVTIGLVKFAKLIMWFAVILLFKKVETNLVTRSSSENDEKV